MTTVDFIQYVNSIRKQFKNSWYSIDQNVDGKQVTIKAYNTWVQVIKIKYPNGKIIKDSSPMDMSVKDFNAWFNRVLTD